MIVYWAVGYAFAFGNTVVTGSDGNYTYHPANSFIGNNHFFLTGAENAAHYNIPGYPERVIHLGSFYGEFFFNFVFAATATTITSGAIVERSQLSSYLVCFSNKFKKISTTDLDLQFLPHRLHSTCDSPLDLVNWLSALSAFLV